MPPTPADVDRYLGAAGAGWEEVRARLREGTEPSLRELLSTPLMLSVAVLAYRGGDPTHLCGMEPAGGQRDRLWSRYGVAYRIRRKAATRQDHEPLEGLPPSGNPKALLRMEAVGTAAGRSPPGGGILHCGTPGARYADSPSSASDPKGS